MSGESKTDFDAIIQNYLPFCDAVSAWNRIEELGYENKGIVGVMAQLSEMFRQVVDEPRVIYLAVQEVRSRSVYVRWRRKGVNGNQKYLLFSSIRGRDFLLNQTEVTRLLYLKYNHWALTLNLAHSIRLNEIRRIKKYLQTL